MRARRSGAPVLAAVLAALLVAAPAAQATTVGKAAGDFTLKTHDGKSLTLSKLKGKRGVVLVFFATWCAPCIAEVPQVKKFVVESRRRNVLVYGVNVQQPERVVQRFVKDQAVNYRILLDRDAAVARAYGVRGIPTLLGIDGDGIVRFRGHAIPKDHDAFIKLLTKPLPAKAKPSAK